MTTRLETFELQARNDVQGVALASLPAAEASGKRMGAGWAAEVNACDPAERAFLTSALQGMLHRLSAEYQPTLKPDRQIDEALAFLEGALKGFREAIGARP